MHPSTGYDGTLGEPHLLYYQFKHSQNSGLQYISCTLAPVYAPSRLQATVKLYHDAPSLQSLPAQSDAAVCLVDG